MSELWRNLNLSRIGAIEREVVEVGKAEDILFIVRSFVPGMVENGISTKNGSTIGETKQNVLSL